MLPESHTARSGWILTDAKREAGGARAAKTCEMWAPPHLPGPRAPVCRVCWWRSRPSWWEMEECEECGPGVAINYCELHTIDIVKLIHPALKFRPHILTLDSNLDSGSSTDAWRYWPFWRARNLRLMRSKLSCVTTDHKSSIRSKEKNAHQMIL